MRSALKKFTLLTFVFITTISAIYGGLVINTKMYEKSQASTPIFEQKNDNGQLTSKDFTVDGILRTNGDVFLNSGEIEISSSNGSVLSVDELGKIVLVKDEVGNTQNYVTNSYVTQNITEASESPFYVLESENGDNIGLGLDTPDAKFHLKTTHSEKIGLIIQGEDGQSADLTQWQNDLGQIRAKITSDGTLVLDNSASHQIEVRPSGDTGYLSSSGGAIFIENSNNIGSGIGIYSNAGDEALGNMINVKVDNPAYNQAAFYMNYDGISNAVEIVSNTNDSSSNALAVTNNNTSDSALGIIGYESGRGTIKVSHYKPSSSDANASGISIDLKGTGTAAQGLYVDSTATGGTSGNLLRLRNQTVDRFVVGSTGSVAIGGYGTDTSVTKYGNTTGDQFFIGTNGAFRVQRSATDSEAFRTQVNGDTQGRWLGTSDGKLKFGSGTATQDVVLSRTGTGLFKMDADIHITGNLGVGTGTFDATADKVLTFTNGTAPGASVTDGVQLWAEDVSSSSELRVRDEAGNTTTLSPHNFSLIPEGSSEDMAWAYYSQKNDIAINADMTKALRVLEKLSGEKLVYITNLKTGEKIEMETDAYRNANIFDNVRDDKELSLTVSDVLNVAVNKQEFEKHVSMLDSVWEFISNVSFKGHISVSADTAGNILVSKGTKRIKVNFSTEYDKEPLVYVSSESSSKFRVENITKSGFEISFENYLSEDTSIKWFAISSEDNGGNFEIIERSE